MNLSRGETVSQTTLISEEISFEWKFFCEVFTVISKNKNNTNVSKKNSK